MEADRMANLRIVEKELVPERQVVLEERRMRVDNVPSSLLDEAVREQLFGRHKPYGMPVSGYVDDVKRLTVTDLMAFYGKYYAPNNASIAIVGDFRPDEVKPLVEKYFGPIPRGPQPPPVTAKTLPHTQEVRETLRDQVQLAKVLIGYVGPKPLENPAIGPLVRVLAGGKSSRLYHDLVYEKKIAQDVSANWDPSMQLGGIFEITATVQAGHTPEEVEAALSEEVRRLREAPPSPEELERAKRNLESGLFAQLENVGGFGGKADQLNFFEMWARDPAAFTRNLDATLAVTPAQVQAVARQYLNDEQRVVITVLPEQKQAAAGGGR